MDAPFWLLYCEAAKTSIGFFGKSSFAFVLGCFISAMIQAFVPKGKITPYIGNPRPQSLGLATFFGHLIVMLVCRSGDSPFIAAQGRPFFCGRGLHVHFHQSGHRAGHSHFNLSRWQFLTAEVIGGRLLITISSILNVLTFPKNWLDSALNMTIANNLGKTIQGRPKSTGERNTPETMMSVSLGS